MTAPPPLRIGIDLGGTKIAAVGLRPDDSELIRIRTATPRNDYDATIAAILALIGQIETEVGLAGTIGIGIPGSISPSTGAVQNANSTWLNGRPLAEDVIRALGRRAVFTNDANCFALSEATDGAGRGRRSVFGVILGTGCGGGIVIDGRLLDGPHRIGGEWGHTPLPWARDGEHPGPLCWCGRQGCMETWVAGPALAADHARCGGGGASSAEAIATAAATGDLVAQAALDRHADRLARGLAQVVNFVDPEVIVLGGGLSQLAHLYEVLPNLMAAHIFADQPRACILPPAWGDDSGVRGAARLGGLATRSGEAGAASTLDARS